VGDGTGKQVIMEEARKEQTGRLGWPEGEPHPSWAEVNWVQVQEAEAWYRAVFQLNELGDTKAIIKLPLPFVWKLLATHAAPAKAEVLELKQHVARLEGAIPDYWKDAIGEYKFAVLGKHSGSHPTTVKRVLAAVAGTESADVIAALAFQSCIAWEGMRYLGEQVTEEQQRAAAAEERENVLTEKLAKLSAVGTEQKEEVHGIRNISERTSR
jgi:hypothetical protein